MVFFVSLSPVLQAGLEEDQDPYTLDYTVGPSSRLAQEERRLYVCNQQGRKLLNCQNIPQKDVQKYEKSRSLKECEGILSFFKVLSRQDKKK